MKENKKKQKKYIIVFQNCPYFDGYICDRIKFKQLCDYTGEDYCYFAVAKKKPLKTT